MEDQDTSARSRARTVEALAAYASAQSELGREFARRMSMHATDSAAVVEILRAEERGTPLTPARLSERIGLTSGATSILLNRLEGAGHITRRRGHSDRRLVSLHSTASVHEAADRFFAPVRASLDTVMDDQPPERLEAVALLLESFRDALEERLRDGAEAESTSA